MSTQRPPQGIAVVAYHHWLTGGVAVVSVASLYFFLHDSPHFTIDSSAYPIGLGIGGLYLATGALVWFGWPPGKLLSRICGLLYLARPNTGSRLWRYMDSPEFKAHFKRSSRSGPV